jgi:hypothetical protein
LQAVLAEWIEVLRLQLSGRPLVIESLGNQLLSRIRRPVTNSRQTGAFVTDACALAAAIMVSIGVLVFSAAR